MVNSKKLLVRDIPLLKDLHKINLKALEHTAIFMLLIDFFQSNYLCVFIRSVTWCYVLLLQGSLWKSRQTCQGKILVRCATDFHSCLHRSKQTSKLQLLSSWHFTFFNNLRKPVLNLYIATRLSTKEFLIIVQHIQLRNSYYCSCNMQITEVAD